MTKDNLLDLIEMIEKDGFNYVIGIIKPRAGDLEHEEIELFTNFGNSGLDKLLKVLKEVKKTNQKPKEKQESSLQKPEDKVK